MEDDRWDRGGPEDETPAFIVGESSIHIIDLVIGNPNVVAYLKKFRHWQGDGVEAIIKMMDAGFDALYAKPYEQPDAADFAQAADELRELKEHRG